MRIEGFDIESTDEEIKKAFGYTDMVHRMIDGQVKEVPNPQTIEEYIRDWAKGHVTNKLEEKPCSC